MRTQIRCVAQANSEVGEAIQRGRLTEAAGRRAVRPEQAEITRLRAELSRVKMDVNSRKSGSVLCQREFVKYAFMPVELVTYTLSIVCRVLYATRLGFHT